MADEIGSKTRNQELPSPWPCNNAKLICIATDVEPIIKPLMGISTRVTRNVKGLQRHPWRLALLRTLANITMLLAPLSPGFVHAGETNNTIAPFERIYKNARAEYQAHSNRLETACALARACFDLAEFPQEEGSRTALGREGMAAARHVLSKEPTNAAAHYYLALNIGEVARTKRMSALKLVSDMEEELLIARNLDEKLDYAGPDRCLGLLYRDAPGWPVSVGNRNKARQYLLRALDLSPDYPENWINMIESHIEWGDTARASHDAVLLNEIWPSARSKFSGELWLASWDDWDDRWAKIQKKLFDKAKPSLPRREKTPFLPSP